MSDFIRDSIGADGLCRPGAGSAVTWRVLRNDHQVLWAAKPAGMRPKGLAYASLDAIAPRRVPHLSTDCHTESGTFSVSFSDKENEPACEDALPLREGATIVGASTKARGLRVGMIRQGPFLLLGDGHREALPSLAPATIDHVAAALGRHPRSEPMGPLATGIARLVRSFHGSCLIAFWSTGEERPNGSMRRRGRGIHHIHWRVSRIGSLEPPGRAEGPLQAT